MPRVTEILDAIVEPELLKWMLNTPKAKREAISKEAIRIGSLVDDLIQQDIKDGGYLASEGDMPVENCLKGWELFKQDNPSFMGSISEMQTELVLDDITGHPDFIIGNKNHWGVVDLKCASAVRPKYWTQCAAYSHLKLNSSDWYFPDFIGVLRLDKQTGLYDYKTNSDSDYIAYEMDVFKAYYIAYQHAEKNREMIRQQLEKELLQ